MKIKPALIFFIICISIAVYYAGWILVKPKKIKQLSDSEIQSRGELHYANKNYDSLLILGDAVILQDSNNPRGYYWKAIGYYFLRDFRSSFSYADVALKHGGEVCEYYFWRGDSRKFLGDTTGAIYDYSRAILLDPVYIPAVNNRATLYKHIGKHDSALMDYESIISLDTSDATVNSNLGFTYIDLGLYDSAIYSFTRAIRHNGKVHAYFGRGQAYYETGNYDLAVADFTTAISLDKSNSEYFLNRAIAYDKLNKQAHMCDDLDAARLMGNEKASKLYIQKNCHKY